MKLNKHGIIHLLDNSIEVNLIIRFEQTEIKTTSKPLIRLAMGTINDDVDIEVEGNMRIVINKKQKPWYKAKKLE